MKGAVPLVMHVIHRLDFGGLENGLVNLINGMPSDCFRHVIVCLAGFNPDFRQRLRRADTWVIPLDKRPGKDLAVYHRAWRVMRQLRPDIVHTRNFGTVDLQWIAAVAGIVKRVHGEHGWEASDPRGIDRRKLRIRRACRPVITRYTAVSRDIARWLEREVGIGPDRIRQLGNGVDTTRFSPAPNLPSRDRSAGPLSEADRLGTSRRGGNALGEIVTLGSVGRLDPVKNHSALLKAFASLQRHVPSLRLTIVGDGPLRGSLEAEVRALGVADLVAFTGLRSDTPELMRRFDILVQPSVNEGISNTILEAMATGLPVVASRVGGNPELIADEVTGRLYDPSDSTGLEKALIPYVVESTLRQAHGRAARERVVQNFSLGAMVTRYLDFYEELMAPDPAKLRRRYG